jgi:hypothetical protein
LAAANDLRRGPFCPCYEPSLLAAFLFTGSLVLIAAYCALPLFFLFSCITSRLLQAMEKAKRDPSKRSPAGKAADEQQHNDAACGPCQRCGNVLRVFQGASSAVPVAIRLLLRANIVLKFICKCDHICALSCRVHACTLVARILLRKKRTQRVDGVVQCVSFPISEFLTICSRLPVL